MRFAQQTPSAPTRLLAILLTLTATTAAAAPARVSPPARTSTVRVWIQEAWRALTGLSGKEPTIPVHPSRGPGIDPDGSSQAGLARPTTS